MTSRGKAQSKLGIYSCAGLGQDDLMFRGQAAAGAEMVKVAEVAPTELQDLGGGSQSQPTT